MDSKCCICKKEIDGESFAILTMSAYGTPRYICDGCDGELSRAMGAREISKITEAMDKIGEKMAKNNVDESIVLTTVNGIMTEARERAEKIKNGEYDFSLDEEISESEAEEEIPEELRETEEDRELDRKEAEKNKKLDKITNIVCFVMLAAALGFLIYKIVSSYI